MNVHPSTALRSGVPTTAEHGPATTSAAAGDSLPPGTWAVGVTEAPSWASPGPDITTPVPARVINALFGGFHNFGADRDLADQIRQAWPGYAPLLWAEKAYTIRVVAWLTAQGIRQFLDIGCGLAVIGAVHETAGPPTRIVYADLDPIAVALIRHTVADHRNVAVVHGDLRKPDSILDHHTTLTQLDFSDPIGILLTGVLPHVADRDNPSGAIAQIRQTVVPGSYLAVSHLAPVAAARREQELNFPPSPDTRGLGSAAGDQLGVWSCS